MPEHLIRLRWAWEWRLADGPRRLDLPTSWPPGLSGPLQISRRFGRPPTDGDRESVALRLEDVPGLLAVRLNDADLALSADDGSPREIPLSGILRPKNLLVLEADPSRVGGDPWGAISLVIRGS